MRLPSLNTAGPLQTASDRLLPLQTAGFSPVAALHLAALASGSGRLGGSVACAAAPSAGWRAAPAAGGVEKRRREGSGRLECGPVEDDGRRSLLAGRAAAHRVLDVSVSG